MMVVMATEINQSHPLFNQVENEHHTEAKYLLFVIRSAGRCVVQSGFCDINLLCKVMVNKSQDENMYADYTRPTVV